MFSSLYHELRICPYGHTANGQPRRVLRGLPPGFGVCSGTSELTIYSILRRCSQPTSAAPRLPSVTVPGTGIVCGHVPYR